MPKLCHPRKPYFLILRTLNVTAIDTGSATDSAVDQTDTVPK